MRWQVSLLIKSLLYMIEDIVFVLNFKRRFILINQHLKPVQMLYKSCVSWYSLNTALHKSVKGVYNIGPADPVPDTDAVSIFHRFNW